MEEDIVELCENYKEYIQEKDKEITFFEVCKHLKGKFRDKIENISEKLLEMKKKKVIDCRKQLQDVRVELLDDKKCCKSLPFDKDILNEVKTKLTEKLEKKKKITIEQSDEISKISSFSQKKSVLIDEGTEICQNDLEIGCRFRNIMFLGKPCDKKHIHFVITEKATKEKLNPNSSSFTQMKLSFEAEFKSATVKNITLIKNTEFEKKFNLVRSKLGQNIGKGDKKDFITTESTETLLYHGTCERFLDDIYNNGFKLPADYNHNINCKNFPGNKTTLPSLCYINCKACCGDQIKQHQWNTCHMYGLGIYFADVNFNYSLLETFKI